MVPAAEFRSYYGRAVLKPPVWTVEIPGYLFTGGLAAGSSMLAAGGDLTGRPALRTAGRLTSLAALLASTGLLVKDLGRPDRFHHMLRVAKPTSPMSVGTWVLTAYGLPAGVAAVAEAARPLVARGRLGLTGRLAVGAGRPAGLAAGVVAAPLATYTAVLLSNTAVPSWHEVHPELPVLFAGSALASGAGVGLLAAPADQAGPARRMAVLGGAAELLAGHRLRHGHGLLSEPYQQGKAGRLLSASEKLTAAGMIGALLGRRNRVVSALSGAALLAGSLAARFGVFEGGVESTKDPRYVVVPQRERLDARQRTQTVAPSTAGTSSPTTG
jgi:hypothetical protein